MSPTLQVPMLEKLVKELPDLLQRNTDLLTGDNVCGFSSITTKCKDST